MDTVKKVASKCQRILRAEPIFCVLLALSWLIAILNITSVSGSWVTYTGKFDKSTNYQTEIKVGLFNNAMNNSWHLAPYSRCVADIKGFNMSLAEASDHQMFCDASLSNGVLLMFSLIMAIVAAFLLTLVVSNTLLESRVLQVKYLCMGIYALTCLINLIAFSLGAGVLFRLTSRDFSTSYYGSGSPLIQGVGFITTVFNWIFCAFALFGVRHMIGTLVNLC